MRLSELRDRALLESTKKPPKELSVPVKALIVAGSILVAPLLMVSGMIFLIGFGIAGSVHGLLRPGDKYDEITDDEFDEIITEMKNLQNELERLKHGSTYYKLVYKYHGVDDFCDREAKGRKKINIKDEFKKGNTVYPVLSVLYYATDGISQYKDLLKSMPNQDIPYYEGENESYLSDIEQAIYEDFGSHMKSLGFDNSLKESKKFPHVEVNVYYGGDGVWVWIYRKGKGMVKRSSGTKTIGELRKLTK